jgi:hypothetical protein
MRPHSCIIINLQVDGANKSPENKDKFSFDPYYVNAVTNLAAVDDPASLFIKSKIFKKSIFTWFQYCRHH